MKVLQCNLKDTQVKPGCLFDCWLKGFNIEYFEVQMTNGD